jgi:type VI secretion system protein ImpE
MNSAEFVQAGRLEEGLSALQAEIRSKPEDTRLRVFLFQLNCALGRLQKALDQLQVLASLNAETMLMAQIFRPVIACEMLRAEVFQGRRSPLIFGEPAEWVGLLLRANELVAKGEFSAAADCRARAFDAAPASSGKVNGEACEWIADADSRLGPVMELIFDGKYYWVPFCRIQKVEAAAPSDLRDLVWLPAQVTWTNGGSVFAHIPVRYPGTENSTDDSLRLSRRTDWQQKPGDTFIGSGQRVLATDANEYPLLSCRSIELAAPA